MSNSSLFNLLHKGQIAIKLSKAALAPPFLPIKLTIGLTYLCQSKCNYCDVWKRYKENPQDVHKELRKSDFSNLFNSLKKSILWVEFTGGEPFLRDDCGEIISAALHETGIFSAAVTSNGLASESVIEQVSQILNKIKTKQLVVGISIDGKPELYERTRGLDGFEVAMQTYLKLKQISHAQNNMRPHIAYTINQFNAGKFIEFYDFVSEKYGIGLDEISFSLQHDFGYYFKNNDFVNTSAESFRKFALKDISCILQTKRKSRNFFLNPLNIFYDYYLEHISNYFAHPDKQVIPCKASDLSAYIDPYGTVYPCILWDKPIGNLNENNFEEIWFSNKRKNAKKEIAGNNCPNCWTPCEAQPSWIGNFCHMKSKNN